MPCCFPTCRSVTYLLADEEDVIPIPRLLPMDSYLDYISNRALPDPSVRSALEGLWSASAIPGSQATIDRLTTALAALGLPGEVNEIATAALETCASCGIDFPDALADLASKAFMIVIQDFQDPYTLNVKQLMKCCVEEITPDGRLIPFCAYNSVGYREQVREQLSGVAVEPVVPNAAELADLLVPTRHGSRTVARRRRRSRAGPGEPRAEAALTAVPSLADLGDLGSPSTGPPPTVTPRRRSRVAPPSTESTSSGSSSARATTPAVSTSRDAWPITSTWNRATRSSTSPPVSAPPRSSSPPNGDVDVVGVDLGAAQVAKATARADAPA